MQKKQSAATVTEHYIFSNIREKSKDKIVQ